MDPANHNQDAQSAPVPGLTGVDLLRYFSLQASEMVDQRIREREERRTKKTAVVLTLLSLVGVSGTLALVNYTLSSAVTDEMDKRFVKVEQGFRAENDRLKEDVKSLLQRQQDLLELRLTGTMDSTARALEQHGMILKHQDDRVQGLGTELGTKVRTEAERAIGSQVDSLRTNLQTEVDYQRLNTFALGLDLQKSFSQSERDAVIDLLRRLKGTEIVARSDFREVLRKIIDSFHSADQDDQIDELDEILGEVTVESPFIVDILINHYGQRVIGSRRALTENGPVVARFQRYLARAHQYGNPEMEIFWELLMEVKGSSPQGIKVNPESIRALKYLDEDDRSFFFVKLVEYSVPSLWVEQPTYASDEIARICKLFRTAYSEELRDVFAGIPQGEERLAGRIAVAARRANLDDAALEEVGHILSELTGETPIPLEG